jgi:subfamily B ATP-binding cassette protein MsbA
LQRLLGRVRPHRGTVAAAIAASVVAAGMGAIWAWLLGPLLQGLLVTSPSTSLGMNGSWLPPMLIAVGAVKALAAWLHAGWMQRVAQAVLAKLRRDLYAKLLELPPKWHQARHSGELMARFSSDLALVELAVGQALSSWAKDALQVLALLGVCAAIDLRLFALTFFVLPLMVWPVSAFAKAVKKATTSTQGSLAALTTLTSEQLHNLPVVQAYRAEGLALGRFDAEQARYFESVRRSLFIRGAFTPSLELLAVLGAALCLAVGANAVATEPALASRLVSFLAAALLLYQPLKALSGSVSQVAQGLAASARLFEVLDAEVTADVGAEAMPLHAAVTLEGVRVRYPDGRLGLDGLSLEVPAGKLTALVGPSGGGKSTTLALLLGFVEAEAGSVTWDGAPLRSLSTRSVRGQVAWVPQEPVLLSGSVRENLLLGASRPNGKYAQPSESPPGHPESSRGGTQQGTSPLPEESRSPSVPRLLSGRTDRASTSLGLNGNPSDPSVQSDEALWLALKRAHAEDFVRGFAHGLDEEVGERGAKLSGGQRQRLALARAFLREPSLLLLDEPTSALDAESQAEVQAGLDALLEGRTALVVAHRLSTVQRAARIHVLEHGRCVESGTHAELMQKGGLYSRMVAQL